MATEAPILVCRGIQHQLADAVSKTVLNFCATHAPAEARGPDDTISLFEALAAVEMAKMRLTSQIGQAFAQRAAQEAQKGIQVAPAGFRPKLVGTT